MVTFQSFSTASMKSARLDPRMRSSDGCQRGAATAVSLGSLYQWRRGMRVELPIHPMPGAAEGLYPDRLLHAGLPMVAQSTSILRFRNIFSKAIAGTLTPLPSSLG